LEKILWGRHKIVGSTFIFPVGIGDAKMLLNVAGTTGKLSLRKRVELGEGASANAISGSRIRFRVRQQGGPGGNIPKRTGGHF
jgi:hypothetical protein